MTDHPLPITSSVFWRKGRFTLTLSRAYPLRAILHRSSRRITMSAGCPKRCISNWSNQCGNCSKTRCARPASSWAYRKKLFTVSLSQDQVWPFAFWAKSRPSDCRSSARQTRLCKAKWKPPIGITKSGNHSLCCSQYNQSALWATSERTKTRSPCGSWKVRTA